ncbi:MAG: hypothetical protein ACLPXZ_18780, partial [Mycobacterium sp.]
MSPVMAIECMNTGKHHTKRYGTVLGVTAVVAGIADAFVIRLPQRAQKAEELRGLPAATVAELNQSGFIALLKPACRRRPERRERLSGVRSWASFLVVDAGEAAVLRRAAVRGFSSTSRISLRGNIFRQTPSGLCLASDGAADV